VQSFEVLTHVDRMREGRYIEKTFIPIYARTVEEPASDLELGENEWLTPFYLMLFENPDNPPPEDLEESKKAAIFVERYTYIDDLLQVILPVTMNVAYIKIQREGFGSLSLAEVEVYSEKLNTLASYELGSPVVATPITNPYQPAMPFSHQFNEFSFDGRWLVQFTQDIGLKPNVTSQLIANAALVAGHEDPLPVDRSGINDRQTRAGPSGSYGTVSDVVLVITDMAGIVHSYYQDLRAEILHLPKYGRIFAAPEHTPHPYANWREAFELGPGGELLPAAGKERPLGPCNGVDTTDGRSGVDTYRFCPDSFGVGPLLDSANIYGSAPEEGKYFRKERALFYQPNLRYLGPDYFTYRIIDGLNVQRHIGSGAGDDPVEHNEVHVHVRNCRRYHSRIHPNPNQEIKYLTAPQHVVHPLCSCAQTETEIVPTNATCTVIRQDLCRPPVVITTVHPTNGKVTKVLSQNSTRLDFLNMCLTCEIDGWRSSSCLTETVRAISLLTSRGSCTDAPPMDCASESITLSGGESVNYYQLNIPGQTVNPDAFTPLGTSIGGYGWYDTGLLQ
jgi:hypothetical protein